MKVFIGFIKLQCIFAMLLTLTACWDYKEITYTLYGTSVGIDYEDGEYVVYIQILNFASIARQEGQVMDKKPIVVGKARGRTITDAIFALYRSEQFLLYWGHVTSIVLTKDAIQKLEIEKLTDVINRFPEIRYNVWIYATGSLFEDIYNVSAFFGFSPYETILMNPIDTYEQYSDIKPIYLFQFLADYLEPGRTAALPYLMIDKGTWKEGEKVSEQIKLGGVYLFEYKKYKGALEHEALVGKSYLDKDMRRMPLTIDDGGHQTLTLIVHTKDYDIKHTFKDGKVRYDLEIDIGAYIEEMEEKIGEKIMTARLEEKIQQDIRMTFEKGLEMGADVYNLNDKVYRYDHKNWEKYIRGKPNEEVIELGDVRVNAVIKHSGKYKERVN
ncbi:Ger(x)C family spore germination protein [Bacillus horti]|uniref:Ger(X)C family germination protein n=1 Tax=Caldalkalibacillus horti TaxID=77523 RepID=A0ABT9W1P4_9BACI|nr:Ger(x)C family spore germination protein [Bacillus horti]MDQ0167169.1 Ger(x)C family germination protein [Bacillus horti]